MHETRRRVWQALGNFYAGPFRVDPALSSLSPHDIEQRRRARLFTVLVATLAILQCGSLAGQALTGAPVNVMLSQTGALVGSAICLLLNWRGHTTVASLLYLFLSTAGVTFSLTQLGGALDLRGLMLLTLLTIFVVLSGLLLPRWAIWLIAACVLAIGVTALLAAPLAVTAPHDAGAVTVRPVVVGVYTLIVLALALLTWIFARSASAGLESVAQALTRERELAALKDFFIIDANHELRTPIMALYNNLELLDLLLTHSAAPERQAQALQRALASGDAVIRLLNTILDPAVLEGKVPPLRIEAVPVGALVRAALETFDPREAGEMLSDTIAAQPRIMRLSVAEACVVRADPDRLRQVLVNLIANALKYSPPDTPLEISAGAPMAESPAAAPRDQMGTQAGDFVELRIRDFGPGIPIGEQPKLFNRFVRLERDIAGPVRGTGIGLYVCRTLIEAMGGVIWLESRGVEGEGSAFCFTLPTPSAPAPPEAPETLQVRSTLVVRQAGESQPSIS